MSKSRYNAADSEHIRAAIQKAMNSACAETMIRDAMDYLSRDALEVLAASSTDEILADAKKLSGPMTSMLLNGLLLTVDGKASAHKYAELIRDSAKSALGDPLPSEATA